MPAMPLRPIPQTLLTLFAPRLKQSTGAFFRTIIGFSRGGLAEGGGGDSSDEPWALERVLPRMEEIRSDGFWADDEEVDDCDCLEEENGVGRE